MSKRLSGLYFLLSALVFFGTHSSQAAQRQLFTTEITKYGSGIYNMSYQDCYNRAVAIGRRLEAKKEIVKFVGAQCSGLRAFEMTISYWAEEALSLEYNNIFDRRHGYYRLMPYSSLPECTAWLAHEIAEYKLAAGEEPLLAYCNDEVQIGEDATRWDAVLVGNHSTSFHAAWTALHPSADYAAQDIPNAVAKNLAGQKDLRVDTVSFYRTGYWWNSVEVRYYGAERKFSTVRFESPSLADCRVTRDEFRRAFAPAQGVLFSHCAQSSLSGYAIEAVVDSRWDDQYEIETYPTKYPSYAQCLGARPSVKAEYETVGQRKVAGVYCEHAWGGEPIYYYATMHVIADVQPSAP